MLYSYCCSAILLEMERHTHAMGLDYAPLLVRHGENKKIKLRTFIFFP